MKKEKVGAIDVGTTKVCTIMADISDNGLRVLGVGVVPSHGLHKGLVVSINEARESIRESVRIAEKMAGYKLESAYVGVTGRHVSAVNKTGSVSITRNNQIVRPDDMKRVLDVARSVKVTSENQVLHVIPRGYTLDGQAGVKNPIGLQAYRLDVETHIITAAATSVQNLMKCIRSIGVEVEDLVMEPLASADAVLEPDEKQSGVLLADMGGGTTDLAIFKDSTIYHTSVLPVAGYQVTRDISIGLGINYELAEEMKKRYGDVTPQQQQEEKGEEIAITGDGHSISYNDLSDIISVRIEELLRLIMLELPQTDYYKLIPSGVVLTGGGANILGIAELGRKVMRMPVRVGRPVRLPGVSETLDNPAHATGVGLLMWNLKNEDTEASRTKRTGLQALLARMLRVFQ
ncbi:MAG: cell division protein FtsA [Dehalococcoidales bacterium]|nr:cell division protein FtsA [Dehalococcoidales bacterium]